MYHAAMSSYYEDLIRDRDPYPVPRDRFFVEKPEPLPPDYYCRHLYQVRDYNSPHFNLWTYCYSRAGAGTNHKGHGNCMHHGGNSAEQVQRYEVLGNPTLNELVLEFLDDPDPLNLHQELAVARAVLQSQVNQQEQREAALLAWYASFDKDRRGLHDHPLYHTKVIQVALDSDLIAEGMTEEEVQAGLEQAHAAFLQERQERGLATDLRVTKPRKMESALALMRAIAEIRALVKDITQLEQEAFLSAYAVERAFEVYGQITREVVMAQLRKEGVNVDIANEVFDTVARKWSQVPVAESRSPRLIASKRGQ